MGQPLAIPNFFSLPGKSFSHQCGRDLLWTKRTAGALAPAVVKYRWFIQRCVSTYGLINSLKYWLLPVVCTVYGGTT
jgi:hypothetical protein